MSTPMTSPAPSPTIVIQPGATILAPDGTVILQVTGLAFLEMENNPTIRIAEGTDLDVPGEGHKASSGTELKGPGTRIGSPENVPPPGAEIVVPACTLIETAKANQRTELAEYTKIKTNEGDPPIVLLLTVTLESTGNA